MLKTRRLGAIAQLQEACKNSPPLGIGSKGQGVAAIQDLLADLGFHLQVSVTKKGADGIFGKETDAAVREFQKQTSLKPDGLVGTQTLATLERIIHKYLSALEVPCHSQEIMSHQTDRIASLSQRRSLYQ
jgi:peptidoglycan hydrolase-like protein with peptidoglycan-binding domain